MIMALLHVTTCILRTERLGYRIQYVAGTRCFSLPCRIQTCS